MGLTKDLGALPRAITVDSSNRVGIGSLVPNSPLDVTSATSASSNIQQWSYNSSPSSYRLQLNTIVTSGLVKYSFDMLNAGTTHNYNLVLDRGNLGIGESNPQARLHVARTDSGEVSRFSAPNGYIPYILIGRPDATNEGLKLSYDSNTGNTSFETVSSHNILFKNNNTERMRIFSSGNVFIGTSPTDAGYKLDVNGTVRATNVDAGQYVIKDSSGTSFISYYNGLPGNSSKSFLIYNAPDSPTAGGMWTVTMVKWFADYGSMMAINCEPGTQNMYVKTVYGGSWSGWVQK